MNNNKIRTCLEIAYNCPFLLLIFSTSFLFFIYSGVSNGRDTDQSIAAIQMDVEGEIPEEYDDTDDVTNENTNKIESDIEEDESLEETEMSPQNENTLENAGTRKEESANIENKAERKNDSTKSQSAVVKRVEKERATKFVEYTPLEIDSIYYSDAGKVALTTTYDYVLENDSYFNDAAFMGDSRTLGISDYAGFDEADFFCENGMTIFKLLEDAGVTYQKTGEKVDLKEMLQEKHYGKIYIMLGMNELGYGDTNRYMKQYLKVLRQIREWQPDAVIFIMANLHVSQEKNNMESEFNNVNINDKNVASARLANGQDIFYLDCNPLFTDDEGYLQADLTFDGVHLYAQHYEKWREFLLEHGVELDSIKNNE